MILSYKKGVGGIRQRYNDMGMVSKEGYERKAAYAARIMAENAKIETLKEEQHSALAELCRLRHQLHSSDERDLFNAESSTDIPEEFDRENTENINIQLQSVGLPALEYLLNMGDIPSDADYYYVLNDSEQDEWERKAEEFNANNPHGVSHSGRSLWIEEGGEFEKFVKILNDFNNMIETYLLNIDKEHGTHYCPTGLTRI